MGRGQTRTNADFSLVFDENLGWQQLDACGDSRRVCQHGDGIEDWAEKDDVLACGHDVKTDHFDLREI